MKFLDQMCIFFVLIRAEKLMAIIMNRRHFHRVVIKRRQFFAVLCATIETRHYFSVVTMSSVPYENSLVPLEGH